MPELETMNGYVVIAETAVRPDERVILAVRADEPRGFEYVTARCRPREEHPRQWYWGRYTLSFPDAVDDFGERGGGVVP